MRGRMDRREEFKRKPEVCKLEVDGQVLDRCTRTPPQYRALISKVKSESKNLNLYVHGDLKTHKK